MLKRTTLACLISVLAMSGFALADTTVAPVATPAPAPATVAPAIANSTTMSVPLNKYGAVDVNATIPFEVQVPPAPADFQAPALNPLIAIWPTLVPAQPNFNVQAYLLMDANSGSVLVEYNGNKRLPPASITKLMLVYIAEQQLANGNIHLDDKVRVPKVAWATGGSRMFLKPGDLVTVQELIDGVIVDSGNDAAVTLATHIAGSQDALVSMMNNQAALLGMTNTHFSDVMGLPAPNHYSSARDLAILAKAIISQYPENLPWFAQKSYTYNNIKQYNFNKLLFIYSYADGLKTGSTKEAGFSLLSTAKMPDNPMRLIAVMLGAPTNDQSASNSKALLIYGFRFFQDQQVYSAGKVLTQATVTSGTVKTFPVGVTQDVYATYPRGNANANTQLSAELQLNTNIVAPVTKGQVVGQVVVKLNNQVVTTAPAVAMTDVPVGSWWQKLINRF